MNKKLVLLGAAMLMTAGVASAQKRVTGQVLDREGNPLIGASVRVEGVQKMTLTDDNGKFVLTDVPASAKKLKISYIGFDSQSVSISSNVKVVLKDNNVLEEAVVIGYGSARKLGTVVGSVAKVGGEKVQNNPTIQIADALQGQVAGLQIFSNSGDASSIDAPSIKIRGTGSLYAGNEPLVVVDGSPVSSSILNMMNANDIESVTTLKDASATSIYGSRAANGVIFIVTKKGRRGEHNAEVSISQKVGWSQLARSLGNPMNSTELLEFQLENNLINTEDYLKYKRHGANTNWQDYYFRDDAPMYETDFSLRAGSERSAYFVSGSYFNNTGVDDASFMKRYNLRANIDTKAFDWLTFGINQNIVYTDQMSNGYTQNGNGGASYSSNALMNLPYWDPYDPTAKENHTYLFAPGYDLRWINDLQPRGTTNIVYNGTAYIQLNPIKGLTLKSQLGLYATDDNSHYSVSTEFPNNGGVAESSRSYARSSQWTITNTAEYRFNIGEDHEITLLAGQEGIKYNYDGFNASAKGSSDDRMLLLSNMTEAELPGESSSEHQYLSFFGRADYSLKKKYFFNFTVRNDQSSLFGSSNRSAMFYSGGAMWNMKSENFMKNLYWLDNLDLRLSVGSTGNSSIGNYASLGIIGDTQYGGDLGWYLQQPGNGDLGWEKQIQTNVGFNARLLNKVTVDFNWYHRKTKDMLMNVPVSQTTGFGSQLKNIGEMSNRGVEVSVNYDIFKTKNFFLSVRANYAYNTNEIDKLFYGLEEWPMYSNLLNYKVGESLNYYMPIYAGVDQKDGAPMWYKKGHKGGMVHEYNPETMTKDASNMNDLYQNTGKSRFAPHTGGFGLTASWKGLTLVTDFAFVAGKYMVDNTYLWMTSKGNLQNLNNGDRDMLHMWKKPGDITDIPGFQYETQFDTRLLKNSSFLRLKNLTLSYDLPSKWMEKTRLIKNTRLSFTGRNLFTITGFDGADPEIDTNIVYGNYPATRQFVLGLDVTF